MNVFALSLLTSLSAPLGGAGPRVEADWHAGPLAFPDAAGLAAGAPERQELIDGAFRLFHAVADTTGDNVVLSPYVLQQALALAYAGAAGHTAQEFREALLWRSDASDILRTLGELERALASQLAAENARIVERHEAEASWRHAPWPAGPPLEEKMMSLSGASRIWPADDVPWRPHAGDALTASGLSLDVEPLPFASRPEDSRQAINAWAAEATRGEICNLVPEGAVNVNTRLALTAALFFEARWTRSFDVLGGDGALDFARGRDDTVRAPGMRRTGLMPVVFDDAYRAVDISYGDGAFALWIVVPNDFWAAARQTPSQATFDDFFARAREARVELSMPTFSLRDGRKMKSILHGLGLQAAFTRGLADFANFTDESIFVDEVYERSTVEVTQHGTRATAAAAVFGCFGSMSNSAPPLPFAVDRPFFFILHDRATRTPLFVGRVVDPTAD